MAFESVFNKNINPLHDIVKRLSIFHLLDEQNMKKTGKAWKIEKLGLDLLNTLIYVFKYSEFEFLQRAVFAAFQNKIKQINAFRRY